MNSIVIYYLVYVRLHHCVAMYHKVRSKLFASEYPRCFIFERRQNNLYLSTSYIYLRHKYIFGHEWYQINWLVN